MDASRFDTISRLFAQRRQPRQSTPAMASTAQDATPAAGTPAAGASDADIFVAATPATGTGTPGAESGGETVSPTGTPDKLTFLFVQSFQAGTIAPKAGTDGRYTVTLEAGLGQTVYFSDRPERLVGVTPTADFLDGLGFPEDNPPNAALVVETGVGETDIAVVELFAPVYDAATHSATYEVEVLANWEATTGLGFTQAPTDLAAVASSFGTAHLFIDDCADSYIMCENPSLLDFMEKEPGLQWRGFYGQGMCWNYGFCMPCEPFGHVQPDQCTTYYHWRDRCNAEWNYCQPGTWLTSTYRVTGSCEPSNYSLFWGVGC